MDASLPRSAGPSKKPITKFEQAEFVHRQLLYDLMSSIYEYILILVQNDSKKQPDERSVANTSIDYRLTPNIESLLLHIHSCLEQIFLNGLRIFKPDKSPDLWRFFDALNWINPHMTVSIGSQTQNVNASQRVQAPKSSRIRNDKALMWLYENLLTNQLTTKLQCLLSDNEHLTSCYEVTLAFFGSKKFVEALYICLTAFDKKQYDYLLRIDQSIYLSVINESLKPSAATPTKMNNKSPRQVTQQCNEYCDTKASKSNIKCDQSVHSFSEKCFEHKSHRKNRSRSRCKIRHSISLKLRKFVSMPDLRLVLKCNGRMARSRSQLIRTKSHRMKLTAENLAINDRQKIPNIRRSVAPSQSDQLGDSVVELQPINLVKCDDIKIHTDRRGELSSNSLSDYNVPKTIGLVKSSNLLPYLNTSHGSGESGSPSKKHASNSAPGDFASFFAANGAKIENRYQRNSFFDNIASSTSSPLCNHDHCALIPNRGQSLTSYLQEAQRNQRNITDIERENAHFSLSDAIISAIEEIKCGRLERKKEKATSQKHQKHPRPLKNWILGDEDNCDKSTFNATDDDTSSFRSEDVTLSQSSSDSDLSHISSDSSITSTADGLETFTVSSNNLTDHTAFAEWAETSLETLAAEAIALSLISKFKGYRLPRAADLLLNNNDEVRLDPASQGSNQVPYTRGTPDWAPPRAQIIFTRHPIPDRRILFEQQKSRCAGCGMHIDAAFVYSLRYCEYSGKHHCTGCHRNQISVIPARVLERWDFSCHPVSVFSYRFLDQIWKIPLFRVPDLSKDLYSRVQSLRVCRWRRLQLKFVHDFIQTCRFADDDKDKIRFDNIPSYIYDDIDNWSMNDLLNVRNRTFEMTINNAIKSGEDHVFNCELCTAHGFICEYCSDKQVIFPWQPKVRRCTKCGSCAHTACSKDQCLKCQRLERRKKQ